MSERGAVIERSIKNAIIFNGYIYSRVKIEIDHINYGLDKATKALCGKKRSNFTFEDVIDFLQLLQGQFFLPKYTDSRFEFYAVEVRCPIKDNNFGKLFRLVFSTSIEHDETIATITLFRIRESSYDKKR